MKKYVYVLCCILLTACDSLLDVVPENASTIGNFFKSEKELESITAEMNSIIRSYFMEDNAHVFMGILADRAENGMDEIRDLKSSALDEDGSPNIIWKNHYEAIYLANLILENIGNIKNVEADRVDFHVGQAYFVKGLLYFDLARRWGKVIITKNTSVTSAYATSPTLEVIDTAIVNAQKAFAILPLFEDMKDISGNVCTIKQYGCKGSAAALLAHLYAWKGSVIDLYGFEGDSKKCYEESVEWATQLISKKVGQYELARTPEELCQYMSDSKAVNPESIFELMLDTYSSSWPTSRVWARFYVNWPVNKYAELGDFEYGNTFYLYNETILEMYSENDKRRKAFFYKFEEASQESSKYYTGYAYLNKWRNGLYIADKYSDTGEDFATFDANYSYWRLADIYLLRAECYVKLGDSRAEGDLNKIRERAGAALYPAAGDGDLQYAIFKEREKELIAEGHRYYDVIRNQYFRTELSPSFSRLTDKDVEDGALFLPISSTAFIMNDVIRQNRYWAKFF